MKGSGISIMIREMHKRQGMNISQIARELHMSRTTVRKYLKGDPGPDKRWGSKRPSKLDSYKPMINDLMDQGIYNATVIFDRIKECGYSGQLSILKAYISPLRPAVAKKGDVRRRYESKPGSQVQMDWGICKYIDQKGKERKVSCFVMILGYSRMRYIEFTKRSDSASLIHCIVNAFEYFGGIPEQVLTDHMKTVVVHADQGKAVWQKEFEHFATDLGFIPKLCRVRRPQTKGKVERLVHYIKDNFIPGRKFTDLTDLNQQAQRWLTVINGREHGTTGTSPRDLLEAEKLKPLPEDGRHLAYKWEKRKVSMEGFVSFNGFKYGVHYQYVDKQVEVLCEQGKLYIRDAGTVIQEHEIRQVGQRYVYAKGQYEGLNVSNGHVGSPRYARQVDQVTVQTRSLDIYNIVSGGVA